MKNPIPVLAACAAVVLLVAGCGKSEPVEALSKANVPTVPGTVVPKLPDPNVPKGVMPPAPHPGQGNDTSSEAFKGGGLPDPHK